MRLLKNDTLVLGVDYQERLIPSMNEKDSFIATSAKLFAGAAVLAVPVVLTTQYVKGLGPTVPEIKAVTEGAVELDKTEFSILDNGPCREWIEKSGRKTVVLCGNETHICIMQTAIDLVAEGYTAVVVADCVASRRAYNKELGLKRLRREGVIVTTYESLLFELLRSKDDPAFKQISQIIR
jgi:nicotinamidase-related amidase